MNMTDDVTLSKKRWEVIYKEEGAGVKKDYKNDPTVLSYKRFLDKYRKDFKKGTFLDLGCGIAYTSAFLAKGGVEIIGVDISHEAIQRSWELFKKENLQGRFIQADLLNLPLRDKSVSFIYSCMGIEYVRDTQKAVQEAFRVLESGGKFVAIVPVVSLSTLTYHQLRGDIPNIAILKNIMEWAHLKLFRGRFLHYGYEQSFTQAQLKRIFERAGFKVNKIDYFDTFYPIEFVPRMFRLLARKILRFRPFWPLVYIEVEK